MSRRASSSSRSKGGTNKYQVLHLVGEGAYGIVLKCRDKETGTEVAIKKFKESEDDELVRKTILREVKVLQMLKHPNIVNLIEAFRRGGKLYLVFEYVEKTVLEILEQHPYGVKPDLVCRYIFQLCLAIQECHRHNVIHRDIKPENLLINPADHTLKLCDFGFARVVDANTRTGLTDYVATRWYRAPELLVGSTTYGFGVDIWAIGCMMGELIDGQPLFPGDSEIDQLYIIQKIIGPLDAIHLEQFLKNERFAGFKFPDMSRPESLRSKYGRKLNKRALSFMNSLLLMDPKNRPTTEVCLQHPYFIQFGAGKDKRDDHLITDRQSKREKRRDKKGDRRKNKSNSGRYKVEGLAKGRLKIGAAASSSSIASRAGGTSTPTVGYAGETKTKFPNCRPNSRKNKPAAQKRRKKKTNMASYGGASNPRYGNTGYPAPYNSGTKYMGKQKYGGKIKSSLGQLKRNSTHNNPHANAPIKTRNVENVAPTGLRSRCAHAPPGKQLAGKQLPQILTEDGQPTRHVVKNEEKFKKSPFYVEPIPQFGHEAFNE